MVVMASVDSMMEVAAEVEVDARLQGAGDFLLDVVGFKIGGVRFEQLDSAQCALNVLFGKLGHAAVVFSRVDQDFCAYRGWTYRAHTAGSIANLDKAGFRAVPGFSPVF